jgi:hypothetical protein
MMLSTSTGGAALPVSQDDILRNMQAAAPARRTGGGGVVYTRLGRDTGALTYGREETPLPLDHDYTVPWREILWGWKSFRGKAVVDSKLIPIAAGACPQPPIPYTPYGVDGPKQAVELRLCSITEVGFCGVFSCLNVSGQNRVLDLWSGIAAQFAVNAQFANPVVRVVVDHYVNSFGTVFVVTFPVRDWLADDGVTLLSKTEPQVALPV